MNNEDMDLPKFALGDKVVMYPWPDQPMQVTSGPVPIRLGLNRVQNAYVVDDGEQEFWCIERLLELVLVVDTTFDEMMETLSGER